VESVVLHCNVVKECNIFYLLVVIITSVKEVMFFPRHPRVFVGWSVCQQDYSEICECIFLKFMERIGLRTRNDQLDFGGDL